MKVKEINGAYGNQIGYNSNRNESFGTDAFVLPVAGCIATGDYGYDIKYNHVCDIAPPDGFSKWYELPEYIPSVRIPLLNDCYLLYGHNGGYNEKHEKFIHRKNSPVYGWKKRHG